MFLPVSVNQLNVCQSLSVCLSLFCLLYVCLSLYTYYKSAFLLDIILLVYSCQLCTCLFLPIVYLPVHFSAKYLPVPFYLQYICEYHSVSSSFSFYICVLSAFCLPASFFLSAIFLPISFYMFVYLYARRFYNIRFNSSLNITV